MPEWTSIALYFVPMALILLLFVRKQARRERAGLAAQDAAIEAGLTQPASLHPRIDPNKCIACGACASVCPEMPGHTVIGIVGGKGELVSPTDCIGHGACQAACPVDAIELVFGTETRGIELPEVAPDFETNVPGIYIAGELGGMGLIRNAIEQGRQAMESIARRTSSGADYDVVIVGAGPAGFSASLLAKEKGLRFVTVEQETLGGTVAHFPRGKLVMTAPAHLPMYGKMRFRETSKEKLLAFWQGVQRDTGLEINFSERVEKIVRAANGFTVTTTRGEYSTGAVLLCLGRRGTPRKLGVPGEDLPKVTYRLIDPAQYSGMHVLVVGGGDSALEAACSIAGEVGTTVTLAYRSAAFTRAKAKNRAAVEAAREAGNLTVLFATNVQRIETGKVVLTGNDGETELDNDAVIISAGGILPTAFLQSIGIATETKYGTR